jgi:hypothetical protein
LSVSRPTNRITISLRAPIFRSLEEMAQASSFPALDAFVSQLIESQVVTFRRSTISPRTPLAPKAESNQVESFLPPRLRLSPEQVQMVLHLRITDAVPVTELAQRFGVAKTTIIRILTNHGAGQHVNYSGRGNNPKSRTQLPKRQL